MKKKLLVIPETTGDPNASNLIKMAAFFGLELIDKPPESSDYAIVASQKSLGVLSNLPPAKAVLVYDCCRNTEKFKVANAHGNLYHVGTVQGITRQLSGLSISEPRRNDSYVLSAVENSDILIRLGTDPFFILQKQDGC